MNVCIVIPIYKNRAELQPYELISIEQCIKVLNKYPLCVVGPAWINWTDYTGFFTDRGVSPEIKIFSDSFFIDIGGYSRLLLSTRFYTSFCDYQYILIHQTDAFVFQDDLMNWCNKDIDYVGAPWFEKFSSTDTGAAFAQGGNGGFSLRNIKAHLKVLHSFSYITPPLANWRGRMSRKLSFAAFLKQLGCFLLDLTVRNNTYWLLNSYRGFEDQFWCLVAARNFSWFKIPGYKEAMNFAIEMQPRRVFDINDHRLPFGCHAWWKYDLAFWKPFIESYGFELKPGNGKITVNKKETSVE